MTTESGKTANETQIRALIDDRTKAVRAKDTVGVTSGIAPDILTFDVVSPLQHIGSDASRKRCRGRYCSPVKATAEEEAAVTLSSSSAEIRRYLGQPLAARKPVGYKREFLDSYRPNETFYLSQAERSRLAQVGMPNFAAEGAGIYAKQILNRLLIDLSWNSSRLEGNTYSLPDTKRLIEFGKEAEGPSGNRSASPILSDSSILPLSGRLSMR